jgi:hypothetical protein
MKLNNLFGPLALIIAKQLVDAMKFLVLLIIFLFGFTMLTMALNEKLVFKDGKAINSFNPTSEEDITTHNLRGITISRTSRVPILRYTRCLG